MADERIKAVVEVRLGSRSEEGRAASVRSSNASLESGQWNFAAWERPVVSAYSRPIGDSRLAGKRPRHIALYKALTAEAYPITLGHEFNTKADQ